MAPPTEALIREVGPRDGFQNEPEIISTDDKVAIIDKLTATGLSRLEITSFVRPDVIPQLADGAEVLSRVQRREGVTFSVLLPNRRGLENALKQRDRIDEISVFLSASETHNMKNVNRTIGQSLAELTGVVADARKDGLRCVAVISTSFGCPYEGHIDPERVFEIAGALTEAGAAEIGFGDTTGMANPLQVGEFFPLAKAALPGAQLTAHFHNTRGQGLANVLAALWAGCTSFESSFGELGGCPVPPGSTGNVATEDVVSMLEEMGVATGIDLPALIETSREMQERLGRKLTSHVLTAGPVEWADSP
ncbi:MAG: hydroxymethylglutaryl-CoA lyase [Solirubrobacterales bacterium]|nr:hydroxymethylglutaryl-CoA lyase [Solirubrobacterales bacterium]